MSDFHFSQERHREQQVRGIPVLPAESLRVFGYAVLLALLSVALSGCRALRSNRAEGRPAIEFTRVPPAAEGGPDTIDIIQGRVVGARPAQQIVLYARNGFWWVQPLPSEEFTRIGKNSTWVAMTHVGTEYAALLVDHGYRPATMLRALPKPGGVIALASARAAPRQSRRLSFSVDTNGESTIPQATAEEPGIFIVRTTHGRTHVEHCTSV